MRMSIPNLPFSGSASGSASTLPSVVITQLCWYLNEEINAFTHTGGHSASLSLSFSLCVYGGGLLVVCS